MTYTLFISDLHLEPNRTDITACFLDLLKNHACNADALYILGDFFEVWVGDDYRSSFTQTITHALKQLTQSGLPVYFMRGNRDFLVGEAFMKMTGCQLLPDPTCIQLYGTKVVLTHGDLLCTDDTKHQAFRRYAQDSRYNCYFLMLPLWLRLWIARKIRNASQKHTYRIDNSTMDVNATAIVQLMQHQQTLLMIHGHTHRPAIHCLSVGEHPAHRIVLSDWHQHGSMLVYHHTGEYELVPLPFQNEYKIT